FAPDVLCGGDDFEVLTLELVVDLLPTWQIQPAPSPGGPGGHQHFLPAEVGEVNDPALAIGNGEIRRHARVEESAPEHRNLAEAPHARIRVGHDRLAGLLREGREVEVLAADHVLR